MEKTPRNKDTKHYRLLAGRTKENMKPAMFKRRDDFIKYLLEGHNQYSAALLAGVPKASARKVSSELWHEPYVQEQLRTLREQMEEEDLITRKEQLLDLKRIAFNVHGGTQGRVQAHALIAKVMGREAPTKVEATVVDGGVMVVPGASSVDEWEQAAAASQAKLKKEVRE